MMAKGTTLSYKKSWKKRENWNANIEKYITYMIQTHDFAM